MPSAIEAAFTAQTVPTSGYQVKAWDPVLTGYRIGKSAEGHAVLLTPPEAAPGVQTRLMRLIMVPRIELQFTDGSSSRLEQVGVVEFRADDRSLTNHFLAVSEALARLLGPSPAPGKVSAAMARLARLFEPAKDRRGSAIGLWGELLLIEASAPSTTLIDAWHSSTDARFDFAIPGERLEVKTTTTDSRIHDFRLWQLTGAGGLQIHVASILTTATGMGTSVADLVDRLDSVLSSDPDRQLKIHEQVSATLGPDWEGSGLKFDEHQGRASLRYMRAEDVPGVDPPPPEVLEVRLKVDCSAVPPAAPSAAALLV